MSALAVSLPTAFLGGLVISAAVEDTPTAFALSLLWGVLSAVIGIVVTDR